MPLILYNKNFEKRQTGQTVPDQNGVGPPQFTMLDSSLLIDTLVEGSNGQTV